MKKRPEHQTAPEKNTSPRTSNRSQGIDLNFMNIWNDSVATLLHPKQYFSKMKKNDGYINPLIKAAIYGLLSGILATIITFIFYRYATLDIIIVYTITIPCLALVLSVILHLVALLCNGNQNFDDTTAVSSASLVIIPIYTLLSIISMWAPLGHGILSLIVSLYGLFILYNGIIHGLGGAVKRAQAIIGIFAILCLLVYGQSIYNAISSPYASYEEIGQVMEDPKLQEIFEELEQPK